MRPKPRLSAILARPAFWTATVGALFALPLARGLSGGRPPASPPVLGRFPELTGRDERGEPAGSAQLRGRAALANLVCATCPAGPAKGLDAMNRLQHRARNLGTALQLVSFVPDAAPSALAALRGGRPASVRWRLVAGTPPRDLFPSGDELLLVDSALRIRGRYRGPAAEDDALRDAALVLAGR